MASWTDDNRCVIHVDRICLWRTRCCPRPRSGSRVSLRGFAFTFHHRFRDLGQTVLPNLGIALFGIRALHCHVRLETCSWGARKPRAHPSEGALRCASRLPFVLCCALEAGTPSPRCCSHSCQAEVLGQGVSAECSTSDCKKSCTYLSDVISSGPWIGRCTSQNITVDNRVRMP